MYDHANVDHEGIELHFGSDRCRYAANFVGWYPDRHPADPKCKSVERWTTTVIVYIFTGMCIR
jgi:hypothetical protein